MLLSLSLFIISFILLWVGSGLAVTAVTKIAHSLRMSHFFISFLVLGIFTSLTEIMVGINAIIERQPEVFVGNLIGSSVVIFLMVIPLLAIIGNGVKLNHTLHFKDLVSVAFVVGMPALLSLDGRISLIDSLVCIAVYGYFVYMHEKKSGNFERLMVLNLGRTAIYISLAKIIIAIVLIFTASRLLVDQTTHLGDMLGVSPYIISIIVIAIGTNIPELSIAARALLSSKKNIAFGNYIGSASLNTLELGILSLVTQKPVPATGSNYSIILFIIGLCIFLYFSKSRSTISRREGAMLLAVYILFTILELTTGPSWSF